YPLDQIKALAIHYIQRGIDYKSIVDSAPDIYVRADHPHPFDPENLGRNRGIGTSDGGRGGGLGGGFKPAILFSGILLGDEKMKNIGIDLHPAAFQEDAQILQLTASTMSGTAIDGSGNEYSFNYSSWGLTVGDVAWSEWWGASKVFGSGRNHPGKIGYAECCTANARIVPAL